MVLTLLQNFIFITILRKSGIRARREKRSPEFWCGKWVKDKKENAGVS